jgi:hypothetical protein
MLDDRAGEVEIGARELSSEQEAPVVSMCDQYPDSRVTS